MTIKEVQITVYGQYVFCFATLRPNKKGSKGWKWALWPYLSIKTFFSLMYLLLELALTAGFKSKPNAFIVLLFEVDPKAQVWND